MRAKPLHPDCTGGIFCAVEGHVRTRSIGPGRYATTHIPLTKAQNRALRDKRRTRQEAKS